MSAVNDMKPLFIVFIIVFLSCERHMPKAIDGQNPYEIPLGNKMQLVDMGLVDGTIKNKKLHCYYVMYGDGIGIAADHIYVFEDSNIVNITQPAGKTDKHISLIIDNDTFKLSK